MSDMAVEKSELEMEGVCEKCGSTVSPGSSFCAKCGAPVKSKKGMWCNNCGALLSPGREFCVGCGQKVEEIPEMTAKHVPAKRKKLLVLIIAAVVVIAAAVVVFVGMGGNDLNNMFKDIAQESWCSIAEDGTWMRIDTNPHNIEDYTETAAFYQLETVMEKLGFPGYVFQEMGETRALDGRQSASSDKYEASWSYHPDNGLEVLINLKK